MKRLLIHQWLLIRHPGQLANSESTVFFVLFVFFVFVCQPHDE